MNTRVGVVFKGEMSVSDVIELARLVDEAGFHSIWAGDGVGHEPFSLLTACAMVTKRVKLGGVRSVFVRSPPTTAMAAADVDSFSEGRYILALGSSHKTKIEGEHGLKFEKPITRLLETVDIIRTLFRDGEVSYHGKVFDLEHFRFVRPLFRKSIPIYFAAVNPKMLELAGEVAEGNIATAHTVERTREAVGLYERGIRRAGKDPALFERVAYLRCVVKEDGAKAKREMRKYLSQWTGLSRYNKLMADAGFEQEARRVRELWLQGDHVGAANAIPDEALSRLTVTGTPEECHERLAEYRKAGVTLPVLFPGDSEQWPSAESSAAQGVRDIVRLLGPGLN